LNFFLLPFGVLFVVRVENTSLLVLDEVEGFAEENTLKNFIMTIVLNKGISTIYDSSMPSRRQKYTETHTKILCSPKFQYSVLYLGFFS
jgi:hypothetical protein